MSDHPPVRTVDTRLAGFTPARSPSDQSQPKDRNARLAMIVEHARAALRGSAEHDKLDRMMLAFLTAWGSASLLPLLAAIIEARAAELPDDAVEALDNAIGKQVHRRAAWLSNREIDQ